MRFFRCIRVLSECYSIAGMRGVKAWLKYLFGMLQLEEIAPKSCVFYLGGHDV